MSARGFEPPTIPQNFPRSYTPGSFLLNRQIPQIDVPDMYQVHLIQCDLWEAITGEHLTPSSICSLCSPFVPYSTQNQTLISAQYYHMAKDRQGCRYLQQKIDTCDPTERNVILNSLIPHLDDLVFDPSSNYVIQKLCEYLTEDAQKKFLQFFLSDLQHVIDQQSSCRVLQKFMEHTSSENVDSIYKASMRSIVSMCSSPNGNHIVQRFIEILPNRINEIVTILQPHVVNLVIDNSGCRVIQKLFDKYPLSNIRPLVDEVLSCADHLATNQYGNYVVQSILEFGTDTDFDILLEKFAGAFYQFSIHKFASNVIEKCIRRANSQQRNEIFNEIIGHEDEYEEERIAKMVGDQFGNYVIQRIIEFGSESQQSAIYNVVYENYDELVKRSYSKHVIIRLSNLGYEF
ncbi:Pumilio-family RNA binding repeat containing protein [Histomonas meleagridis]|uniref:Pumilio-family RNA binding repeat containing protein n=1 Tax=Histomonas meleagridis TaxID=135588 RepID=UPI003559C823|nr:Pumilio-family RNA binding repeat containing protein [Histomonas meleagridis]KAH0801850.1 Pumilio-family RNA binding repeat containing protein [Histomonas meleagridis]